MARADNRRQSRATRGPKDRPNGRGIRDIPPWFAAALYAVVTIALFREFIFSNDMLLGLDTRSLGYMARAFYADALKGGTFPLWNPVILGGTPFLESLAGGDSLYPPSALLLLLLDPFRALGWKLVLHVFLAGVFMYGWIRVLGGSRPAALLAGLAYLMAPYMVTLVFPGQDGKIFVTALTPLLFWTAESALARPRAAGYASVAFVIGMIVLTTHFQMAYFLFGGVGLYAVFRTIQMARGGEDVGDRVISLHGDSEGEPPHPGGSFATSKWRPALTGLALFLASSILGVSIAAVQLLPAVDYVVDSSRRTATTVEASDAEGLAYSSSWGLHPEEIVSLAVPEFIGNTGADAAWARGTYWGRNAAKMNHEYLGLIVLMLAGVSFFGGRLRGIRFFLLGLASLALLFALGRHTPVWRVFYEVVPGISLFRAPSLVIFLVGFSTVTLMALGVDRLLELGDAGTDASWNGPLKFLWGVLGLIAVGTVLAASGTLTSVWTTRVYADISATKVQALTAAIPFIARGFFFALLLAGALVGVVWLHRRARINPLVFVAAIGLFVFVDLVRVDDPFIQTEDFDRFAQSDPNIDFLVRQQVDRGPFRVLSLGGGGQDVRPGMFGIELAGGHHPNDLARYRELIGMEGSGVPNNLVANANVGKLLNISYWMWPEQFGPIQRSGVPEEILSVLQPVSQTQVQDRPFETVFSFPGLPRARLVGDATVLPEDAVVPYILSPSFDPASEVVLSEPFESPLAGRPIEGTVEWLERSPNRHRLRVEADGPALLTLAENWYGGWRARVDGEDAPVLRAYHTLRAVPVGAGTHEVEVYYHSTLLRTALLVTMLALLVTAALAGAGVMQGRLNARTKASL